MRNAFIEELVCLARINPKIALIVGDLGYSVIEPFADEFPDRFFNAGVAEQNMTGIAAGLASEGYHVYTYSIANFPTFRCAEQIRNDVCYHNLPVTVVAVGGGLAYGALGYSHHAVQDYALMRSFPNMLIASPGDPMEVRGCLRYLNDNPGPSYLRIGKAGEQCFHKEVPKISPGKWLEIFPGTESDVILTTGAALQEAMNRKDLEESNNKGIFSLPIWGMETKHLQKSQYEMHSSVSIIEDHLYDGGFGSWMLEALLQNNCSVDNLNINALHPRVTETVGSQALLNQLGWSKIDSSIERDN